MKGTLTNQYDKTLQKYKNNSIFICTLNKKCQTDSRTAYLSIPLVFFLRKKLIKVCTKLHKGIKFVNRIVNMYREGTSIK